MEKPSFRPEVGQEQARAALGSIVLIRPVPHSVLTAIVTLVALAMLAYLFAATWSKKATLSGTLVPASGAIRVLAPQAGVVKARQAVEGERVAAGAPLLHLVDPRATRAGGPVGAATAALARERIATTRRQRDEVLDAGRSEREALRQRIASLESGRPFFAAELGTLAAREALAARAMQRLAELERRGFASAAQRQQKEEDSLEQRARRQALERTRLANEREIAALRASIAESAARSNAQSASLDAQLAALAQEQVERDAQADAVVTAPAAGTVATLLVEAGQVVGAGASLLTLLPEGSPLEAHLYAPSRAVGFIRAGQEVRMRYPAFAYQKFGTYRARVLSVSRSALAPAELGFAPPDGSREPLYRVKVALESQAVTAYGRSEPLQAGMLVEADVFLDERRLIEWVFEPLFSLSGRA